MQALENRVNAHGYELVVDGEWANTGTCYAVAKGTLSPVAARLKYDFQGGEMTFRSLTDIGRATSYVASLSQTGTVDWCYRTGEEVLQAVFEALLGDARPEYHEDEPTGPGELLVPGPHGPLDYWQAIADAESIDQIRAIYDDSNLAADDKLDRIDQQLRAAGR
jgi:hypothetical protein